MYSNDADADAKYILGLVQLIAFICVTVFEYCSVIVLSYSLYNFGYVIRNGSIHGIHASRFSIYMLILHAALSALTALSFGLFLYFFS